MNEGGAMNTQGATARWLVTSPAFWATFWAEKTAHWATEGDETNLAISGALEVGEWAAAAKAICYTGKVEP